MVRSVAQQGGVLRAACCVLSCCVPRAAFVYAVTRHAARSTQHEARSTAPRLGNLLPVGTMARVQSALKQRPAVRATAPARARVSPVATDILLVFAVAALMTLGWLAFSRPVTVTVDGFTDSVRTRRATVGALLGDLGLGLHAANRVTPAAASRIADAGAIQVVRARAVRLLADGQDQTAATWAVTGGDAFADAGIIVDAYDRIQINGVEVLPTTPLPADVRRAHAHDLRPGLRLGAPPD